MQLINAVLCDSKEAVAGDDGIDYLSHSGTTPLNDFVSTLFIVADRAEVQAALWGLYGSHAAQDFEHSPFGQLLGLSLIRIGAGRVEGALGWLRRSGPRWNRGLRWRLKDTVGVAMRPVRNWAHSGGRE